MRGYRLPERVRFQTDRFLEIAPAFRFLIPFFLPRPRYLWRTLSPPLSLAHLPAVCPPTWDDSLKLANANQLKGASRGEPTGSRRRPGSSDAHESGAAATSARAALEASRGAAAQATGTDQAALSDAAANVWVKATDGDSSSATLGSAFRSRF